MVSATASRSIQAIIRISPESCCWAMAGTRPCASNWIAATAWSMAAGRYVVGTTLLVDIGRALACEGKGAYNRPTPAWQIGNRVKKTAKASAHGHDHKH